MDTYYSSFKMESEEEHDAPLADTSAGTEYFDDPVIGQNTIVADPGTAIEGAEIICDNLEIYASDNLDGLCLRLQKIGVGFSFFQYSISPTLQKYVEQSRVMESPLPGGKPKPGPPSGL